MRCRSTLQRVVLYLIGKSAASAFRTAFPNLVSGTSAMRVKRPRAQPVSTRMSDDSLGVEGEWLFSTPEAIPKRTLYLNDGRFVALNDDGTIPIEVERRFYDLVEDVGWDEAVEVMEKGNNVPRTQEALEEELQGDWGIRYSEEGLPGNGLTGAPTAITGHFLRFTLEDSDVRRLQCTETFYDADKAQLSTLAGAYALKVQNETQGAFRKTFPIVYETYQVGDESISRGWLSTFLGERLLIARVEEGFSVYERLDKTQLQSALRKRLE